MEYLKIGDAEFQNTAVLAPMAGVTDFAFRTVAKKFGAALLIGEMTSVKGLCYGDKKSAGYIEVSEAERPMAVQLFGSEPEFFSEAVKIISACRVKPDIIDINCGCPVPKIAGNGAGSALMKNPPLIGRIVKACVGAGNIPVTVKIRSGWDENSKNAVLAAKIAEENGASGIAIHARTREQMYGGKADWSIIKDVKKAVKIPVIGNGDVKDASSYKSIREITECDGVMIGRAALGNPWIFTEIKHHLENGNFSAPPDFYQKSAVMTEHVELIVKNKGERVGMKEARKHIGWYLKGFRNSAVYRAMCGNLSSLEEYYEFTEKLKNEI